MECLLFLREPSYLFRFTVADGSLPTFTKFTQLPKSDLIGGMAVFGPLEDRQVAYFLYSNILELTIDTDYDGRADTFEYERHF